MSSESITFSGATKEWSGYLSWSDTRGPGVVLLQEWWGLVGHIRNVADRLAAEGFVVLCPDLYEGKTTTEPDEAGSLMMALNIDAAAEALSAAVATVLAHPLTQGKSAGVVGFCMGGQLALYTASLDSRIAACVNFYGIHPNVHPDFGRIQGQVLGLFAEHDPYASPAAVQELDAKLTEAGVIHEFHTFPGTQHAFFNEDRPEVYDADAADVAWQKTLGFLRSNLA